MAKKNTRAKDNSSPSIPDKKAGTTTEVKDLLGILDGFFDKRLNWLIWVIMGITFLFGLLLFDTKVSLSGDDSFYIIRASDFIHSFVYPAFQGPLYPMVLSIFVAIFGINLVPLKVLSLISIMGFIYLFFVGFRSRIPSTLLVITLLAVSVNSFILYYASQTYNEAFYIFVQMLVIYVFFRSFIDNEEPLAFKPEMKRHLVLALSLLALALTKNAGYSAVLAVGGYFLLRGQWKNLLYSLATFAMVLLAFQGIKYMLWSDQGLQFSTQGSNLMNKDYYNPQLGKEDLAGFYGRLIDNSQLYFSKHFVTIIGLRKLDPAMAVNGLVTIFVYLLALGSLVITYSKNKYLFFTGLLTGAFFLITFLVLQAKWDQSRLIIPGVPMFLLILLAFVYYISQYKKYKMLQVAIPVLAVIIVFQGLIVTAGTIKTNSENSGKYGGLTPDWKNYLAASEWAAENLPEDAVIACRKPSISFVYGKGRSFYGIMSLPTYSTDVFFKNWESNEKGYMLFNYADFTGKQLSPELYRLVKSNMDAMIFVGDTVYFVDKVADSVQSLFANELANAGINFISSVNGFKAITGENRVMKLYYPDSLLYKLQDAGVTHIMTANLRRNIYQKDGLIINTVERYQAFIQEKYPQLFTKVSQVGADGDEPATIVKIDYEKIGLSVKKSKERIINTE